MLIGCLPAVQSWVRQELAEPHAVPAYKEGYGCLRPLELATQSPHSLPSTWDTHLETSYYKTTSDSL